MLLESNLLSIVDIPFKLSVVDLGLFVYSKTLLLFLQLISATLDHNFMLYVVFIAFNGTCLLDAAVMRMIICTSSLSR